MIIYGILFLLIVGQSDSARYLWNANGYQPGDNFFRTDAPDTILIGNYQLLGILADVETLIALPRSNLGNLLDFGGILIYPKKSIIQWNFPKFFEPDPQKYAYATAAIAPDEFQIAMHGNSDDNRDICFYSRQNITLGFKIPGDQSNPRFKIQLREQFNYGAPNQFERFPFIVHCDRQAFGKGLARFVYLHPGYPKYGHPRDSIVMMEMQFDTIFGVGPGSGYAKFIRGLMLDTIKFIIDRTGSYKITNGSEIRPKAVETESLRAEYLAAKSEKLAGSIYVSEFSSFRIAHYIPGINSDFGCLLTLQGDNDDFVILKGLCKTDSLIIRGSNGYTGWIGYLLYKNSVSVMQDKSYPIVPLYHLEVRPTVTNNTVRLKYVVPEKQSISLDLYDVTGRKVASFIEGTFEKGIYSYELDLNNFNQGVFFLRLENGSEVKTEKIIVVR